MGISKFQIELLKKLPREPEHGKTMTQLADALKGHWGGTTDIGSQRKKIKNNIKSIQKIFPDAVEESQTGREFFYRLKTTAPMLLTPMSQEQMIAFGLLSKFGTDLLPELASRALSPFFEAAQEAATEMANNIGFTPKVSKELGKAWLRKIAVVPAVLPFCPPEVDNEIKKVVYEALLYEYRLQIDITHAATGQREECTVSPLALVQQGVRTYLIGYHSQQRNVQRFLLKRINSVKRSIGHLEIPEGWDLAKFLQIGIGHPVFPVETYGKLEKIELQVDGPSQWIKETPLAEDQKTEDLEDGSYLLKATMPMTEELVHWILSMAYHVKVIKPDYLVQRLKDDLLKSSQMYL